MMRLLSLLLAFGLPAVLGEEIAVACSIQTYEAMMATVGDSVVFTWSGGHNVFLHPRYVRRGRLG